MSFSLFGTNAALLDRICALPNIKRGLRPQMISEKASKAGIYYLRERQTYYHC